MRRLVTILLAGGVEKLAADEGLSFFRKAQGMRNATPVIVVVELMLAAAPVLAVSQSPPGQLNLAFKCRADNDLYRVVTTNGEQYSRYDTAAEVIEKSPPGMGVLILADDYPTKTTSFDSQLFEAAAKKKLRLFVEYPSALPGLSVGHPRRTKWERMVVTSDAFGVALRKMRILAIHDCHFLPVEAENPHLVVARVAGYDTAVFGLPDKDVYPILFEHPHGEVLLATTKLSQFVTGRYAPTEAWGAVWQMILGWLQPGKTIPQLKWTPTVRPSFGQADELASDAELQAIRRGVQWYKNAGLLVSESAAPDKSSPVADGRGGVMEGFKSSIRFDGTQRVNGILRNDCTGESSMAMAFGGRVLRDSFYSSVAANLSDFIYFHSDLAKGPRANPDDPSYGLVAWAVNQKSGVYYGDDNARSLLGTLATAALLRSDRWDERVLMGILANFRTTGPEGFREARIDEEPLQKNGWQYYWKKPEGKWKDPWNKNMLRAERYWPHYQAWPWACYLWLYDKTGFEPLLERTRTGIRLMMEAYPGRWAWVNDQVNLERARFLISLAWLIRVDDTPEHRAWLKLIATDLLADQHACGAIAERIVASAASNEAYGTYEASLLQENGDCVSDMLYTMNFAFIGLHEAAAATGDVVLAQAEDRMADFLVRIQTRSEAHRQLDGAWYRGFDFRHWDYWGSSADVGWGVWSIETGWTQGWIVATLALRQMKTSLWELTADSKIAGYMEKSRRIMLPDEVLRQSIAEEVKQSEVK